MNTSRPSLLYGTILLTGTGLFSQVLGFLYRIALSRLIGAEAMGLYQLVMPLYAVFLSLTASGLTVAVSTLSAQRSAREGSRGAGAVLSRCLALFFALAVPLGALAAVGSDAISVAVLGDARTQLGIILLVPCLLLTGVENLHKHCFYGLGRLGPPAAVETAEQVIRAAAVLGLLVWFLPQNEENTVGLIVLGMVVCEVFSALTLVLLFRRHLALSLSSPAAPPPWRQVASIALPVGATSLLGTLMGAATSVLVPQRLVAGGAEPAQAVAAFGVLCGMTLPMLTLPTGFLGAMGLVLTPHLARSAQEGDRVALGEAISRALSAAALIITPAMALLAAAGPALGRALFAQESVGELMLPLAAGVWLSCFHGVLSGVLNAVGQQRDGAWCAILSDAVHLAFTWWAVPVWGLAGYAAGLAASALVGIVLTFRAAAPAAGLTWRLWLRFLPALLAALLAGLCAALLLRALEGAGLSLLSAGLAALGFGLVLYGAALVAQGGLLLVPMGHRPQRARH